MRSDYSIIACGKLLIFVVTFAMSSFSSPGLAQQRLSPSDIENLLTEGVHQARIAELIKQRGVSFEWTDELKRRFKKAGAGDAVMQAVEGAVIRFRLAEQARREELKKQQEVGEKTGKPPAKPDAAPDKQEIKSSEAVKETRS